MSTCDLYDSWKFCFFYLINFEEERDFFIDLSFFELDISLTFKEKSIFSGKLYPEVLAFAFS